MKLIHAILWCFGYSVVEDNTNSPQQTMSHSNSSTSDSSVDVAKIDQEYRQLKITQSLDHSQAWASITDKYKWNPQQAQDMLIKLSNYASSINSTDSNGSVTM